MLELDDFDKGRKWHLIGGTLVIAIALAEWTGAFIFVARTAASLSSMQLTPAGIDQMLGR